MTAVIVDIGEVTADGLTDLERTDAVTVGVVSGDCTGVALAAACTVDLLYCAPEACFGRADSWTEYVLRRATVLVGRRMAGHLAMSGRLLPAHRMARLGFVNTVADAPEVPAQAVAELIRQRPDAAIRTILTQTRRIQWISP
jgi:enoyl-CoA hydratase/carnithine racemase